MTSTQVTIVQAAITALREVAVAADSQLRVASPFISRGIANELLALIDEENLQLQVLTALTEGSVRAGVLQVGGLHDLLAADTEVRSLPNLHAKVVLGDTDHSLIGSGNATHSGLGMSSRSNIELGTYLEGPVVADVRAAFELWWRAAEVVSTEDLRPYEELENEVRSVGSKAGRVHGRALRLESASRVALGEAPVADELWLKPMYGDNREGEWWREQAWMSTAHTLSADGRPMGRPSIRSGHRLLVYVAGTERCPAVYRVTSDPEFRTAGNTPEETAVLGRWGWRFDVQPVVACSLDEAPTLSDVGIQNSSVRQQSHIRMSSGGFEAALEAIGSGRTVTTAQRPARSRVSDGATSEALFRSSLEANAPQHYVELLAFCEKIERAGARVSLSVGKTMWLGEDGPRSVNPSVWPKNGDVGVDFRHLVDKVSHEDLETLASALEQFPTLRSGVARTREGEFNRWLTCRALLDVDHGLDRLADVLIEFSRS